MEKRVSVRQLNQETSAVLDVVEHGGAVTITRDGRPVARLVPLRAKSTRLEGLVGSGLASAPTAPNHPVHMPRRFGDPHLEVATAIAAMREEEST